MRLPIVVIAMLAVSAAGFGQQAAREPAPGRGTAGTAVIIGTIVSAQPGQTPIRRALVTLSGGPGGERRTASDDLGRFRFEVLPAGRYTLTASKPAYLTTAYGATRPGRAGTTLALDADEKREVSLHMARGAALEGRVSNPAGSPLAGVPVYALEAGNSAAIWSSRLLRTDTNTPVVLTDDRGVFRLFGLAPGSYAIGTMLPATGAGDIEITSDEEIDFLLARQARRAAGPLTGSGAPGQPAAADIVLDDAPESVSIPFIYFPGVAVFSQAQRIDVVAGDERRGLDFVAAPVPAGTIDGVVSRSDGGPLVGTNLSIYWDGPRTFQTTNRPILAQPVDENGRFRFTSVPPGEHTIIASAMPAGDVAGAEQLFGRVDLTVAGQHASGVSLVLEPGITVSGRAVFESTSPPGPGDIEGINVRLLIEGGGWMSRSRGTTIGTALFSRPGRNLTNDGTFALIGLAPGPHTLGVRLPAPLQEQWWLRSAIADGRDLLDGTVEIGNQDIRNVVLTFTDTRNELAGRLQTASGLPAPEYHVVAFPADRNLWRTGSRRIQSTRPDSDGQYLMRDLPAGTYYLAALTDLEPRDLEDLSFLELMAGGVTVQVVDGERVIQDLQIAR